MNLRQSNTVNMYRAVLTVLEKNKHLYSENVAFTNLVKRLQENVQTITNISTKQETIRRGVALDKTQLKENLCSTAFTVAALLKSYAAQQKMNELKEAMNFREDELLRSRDELLIARCQLINEKATEYEQDLVAFGFTPELRDTLHELLDQYHHKKSSPRVARTERTVATGSLAELMKENRLLLKEQLDAAIQLYRSTQSNFFNQYKEARRIIDTGIRHEGEQPAATPIK